MNNWTESNSSESSISGSECSNIVVDVSFLVLNTIQAIAIFVGNLLTSVVFLSKRQLRQSFMNVFLVSLAIADFFVSLLVFPGHVVLCKTCVTSQFSKTDTVCIVFDGIKDYVFLTTVFNILAITFDRYNAVLRPLKYAQRITKKSVAIILICIWLVPWPLSFMKQIIFSIEPGMVIHENKYDNVIVFACIIAPMFPIALVNGMITKAIQMQVSKISFQGNQYVYEPRLDGNQSKLDVVGCHGDYQGKVEGGRYDNETKNLQMRRRKSFADESVRDECQPSKNKNMNEKRVYYERSLNKAHCIDPVHNAAIASGLNTVRPEEHVTSLSRDAMVTSMDIDASLQNTSRCNASLGNILKNDAFHKSALNQEKMNLNDRLKSLKKASIKNHKRKRKYGVDHSGISNGGFTAYQEGDPDASRTIKKPSQALKLCTSKDYTNNNDNNDNNSNNLKGEPITTMFTKRLRKISRDLRERNGTRSCLMIALIFVVCWVPRCLLNVLRLFASDSVDIYILEKISMLFLFFQSLINPIVYSFYRTDFRQAAKDLLRKTVA